MLAAGVRLEQAVRLANRAGGIKVGEARHGRRHAQRTLRISHAATSSQARQDSSARGSSPRSTGPASREILAVDDLENGAKAKNLAGVEIEDYLDKREFLSQLETGRLDGSIEAILHQGACSDTMESDGRYMMENNYAYSKALFDWCQDEEVPFIYASSAAVYGAGQGVRRGARERGSAERLRVLEVPVRPVRAQADRGAHGPGRRAALLQRLRAERGAQGAHGLGRFPRLQPVPRRGARQALRRLGRLRRRRAAARFRARGRRGQREPVAAREPRTSRASSIAAPGARRPSTRSRRR